MGEISKEEEKRIMQEVLQVGKERELEISVGHDKGLVILEYCLFRNYHTLTPETITRLKEIYSEYRLSFSPEMSITLFSCISSGYGQLSFFEEGAQLELCRDIISDKNNWIPMPAFS